MINIFIDTTGSMSVMGKNSGAIYIAKSIEDYCSRVNIETTFYKLNNTKIEDLTTLIFEDSFLVYEFNNCENSILISDGLFECSQENIFDISFLIGIDADENNLEKLSDKVYKCENIISALEYLIFKSSIKNHSNNNTKQEEDDDEW